MLSYQFYKISHLIGLILVVSSLGGMTLNIILDGTRDHIWKKPVMMAHGFGMVLLLVGGMGMLARMGVAHSGLPAWVWLKMFIWLLLGLPSLVLKKKPDWARGLWFGVIFLAACAGYIAVFKPL